MLLLVCALPLAWAQLLAVPPLTGRVIDQTNTLSASELEDLSGRLEALENAHGAQAVLLLVPSTAPEDIAAYANRVANTWKLGRREVGDGLLLIVAKDDRRMRIEVAKALEGSVPDIAAKRIIDDVLTPAFRQGRFAQGLGDAVERISALIAGEPALAKPGQDGAQAQDDDLATALGLAAVVLALLYFLFGLRLAAIWGVGAAGLLLVSGAPSGENVDLLIGWSAMLFLLTMMWTVLRATRRGSHSAGGAGGFEGDRIRWTGGADSGWGSGSDSGFSSGGGGDFGGGGASGSW
ncbi:TPM domain-containing protein [Comamonas sp. NLF-1-9]|nr:TPM domain-containing protein [Comamonas sp. NLF-1-9]